MELDKLITAVQKYIDTRRELGDLTDVLPEEISNPNHRGVRNRMPRCTLEAKQKFNQAKQEMENILNAYIDKRVQIIIKSVNNYSE